MNSYIHILVLTVLCGISMSCADDSLLTCTTTEKRTQYVYCHMETLCDSEGGWTRLAHIDMTDPSSENCPGGLRLYDVDGVRACGRPVSGGGSCHSVKYSSHGIQYNQVWKS